MQISKSYENFLVFLAPLINSVAGIAIDLYAPSLPTIGREFHVSLSTMQNTITITLIGYAIGQLFFGLLADWRGRRTSILFGLSLFIIGSLVPAFSTSIEQLMLGRALQGFAIGSCQVVARALLVDNIKGERFAVAIIYLSLAFGLGPVIAPYIGGLVEEGVGWRWNFGVYVAYGIFVLTFAFFGLRESLEREKRRSPFLNILSYREILEDGRFISAVALMGCSFSACLMWNVIGPYVVQEKLGYSASFFGTTALGVGMSYLTGTLTNRFLIKRVHVERLMKVGLFIFALGVVTISSHANSLHLPTALAGAMLIGFSQGFLFPNGLARSMSRFPHRAGVAASLQGFLMLVFGSIVSGLVSQISIESNGTMVMIFSTMWLLQLTTFCFLRQASLRSESY